MPFKKQIMTEAERAERDRQRGLVETKALRMYDKLNRDQDVVIKVSKAECIRRARNALRRAPE